MHIIQPDEREILKKQRYAIIGEHSGVKLCHWVGESLLRRRICYKSKFYGIATHRCIQFTPSLLDCNQKCLFCWRYQESTSKTSDYTDEPVFLLEEAIKAQRKLLTGFKGDSRCNLTLWKEAMEPKHIAISLSGEPLLYPRLDEFICACHEKGLTTFLVSNGTLPDALSRLKEPPTQLYTTIAAPNEDIHSKLCRPDNPNLWKRFKKTLELLPSISTRKVIRHTLVKGYNLGYEKEYAKLDELAEADFIEAKGYVFVGSSRQRLSLSNMPSHEEVLEFARNLAEELNYRIVDESPASRVVLLKSPRSQQEAHLKLL